MNRLIEVFKHAIVGISCCFFVAVALCAAFSPHFISDAPIFVTVEQIIDFFKTDYTFVNAAILVLVTIYGAISVAQSVVAFKLHRLDK